MLKLLQGIIIIHTFEGFSEKQPAAVGGGVVDKNILHSTTSATNTTDASDTIKTTDDTIDYTSDYAMLCNITTFVYSTNLTINTNTMAKGSKSTKKKGGGKC